MTKVVEKSSERERWSRVRDLFIRVLALAPKERDALLYEMEKTDPSLRQELGQLLEADSAHASKSLTGVVADAVNCADQARQQQIIGTAFGPYRLLSILGHGGAGTVYLAERIDQQYTSQVAIKIVEDINGSSNLLRRFQAERQILARLNHPYIARLIDAGETTQGLTYIVMEYVKGERVDGYCDNRSMSIRERLQLFVKVCEAVQFAHQNLIIHRDLKPANILVTDAGMPKLLDFGVAKLLDPTDELASLVLTQHNDRPHTPEYASPEQILGKPTSTTSDIYALGIVLYELLTGTRPYTLYSSDHIQLQSAICSTDPLKPSDAPSTIEAASIHAGNRSTTPSKLKHALAGDIDAIVLRALRKEPDQRYGSVEQLASDVQKHLAGEPVSARRGNKLYYASRFLRRHGFVSAIAVTGIALLISFAIYTWIQAKHISSERDRAEIVSNFMLDVFGAADPYVTQGQEVTARELLDKAADRIDKELADQPEARAQLTEAIGTAYLGQGLANRAIPYLENAIAFYRKSHISGSNVARALGLLANAERWTGDFRAAESSFQEATSLLEQQQKQLSLEYIEVLRGRAWLEHIQGNVSQTIRYLEHALYLSEQLYGVRSHERAAILADLGSPLTWENNLTAAERVTREALSIFDSIGHQSHPDRLHAEAQLGEVLSHEGKLEEAEQRLEHAANELRREFRKSSRFLYVLTDLSDVKRTKGHYDEAKKLIDEAIALASETLGKNNNSVGNMLVYRAAILADVGQLAEAEQTCRNALEILRASLPADNQFTASAEHQLGLVLLAENRLEESTEVLRASIARWQRANAPRWRAARSQSALGEVLFKRGQIEEGKKDLAQGYDVLLQDLGVNHEETRLAKARLERCTPRFVAKAERIERPVTAATN